MSATVQSEIGAFYWRGQCYVASLAAVGTQFVMLAESQILNPAGELGLLVDQAREGACRATGENSGAKSYGKNHRCNFHGIFLSSSGVNQMKNKIRTQSRIDYRYEGQASKRHHRSVTANRIQYNEQSTY